MKSRVSLPKVKDGLKKLGYDYTQEGDTFIVKSPLWDAPITFHSSYWLGNWFYYHVGLDKPS